jgi:ribonuclease HII
MNIDKEKFTKALARLAFETILFQTAFLEKDPDLKDLREAAMTDSKKLIAEARKEIFEMVGLEVTEKEFLEETTNYVGAKIVEELSKLGGAL